MDKREHDKASAEPVLHVKINDESGAFEGFVLRRGDVVLQELNKNFDGSFSFTKPVAGMAEKIDLHEALSMTETARGFASALSIGNTTYATRDEGIIGLTNLLVRNGIVPHYLEMLQAAGIPKAEIDAIMESKSYTAEKDKVLSEILDAKARYEKSTVRMSTENGVPMAILYSDGATVQSAYLSGHHRYTLEKDGKKEEKTLDELLHYTASYADKVKTLLVDNQPADKEYFLKRLNAAEFSVKETGLLQAVGTIMADKGLTSAEDQQHQALLRQALADNAFNVFTAQVGEDISEKDLGALAETSHISKKILGAALKQVNGHEK